MVYAGGKETGIVIFALVLVAPDTERNDVADELFALNNKNFSPVAQRRRFPQNGKAFEIFAGRLFYRQTVERRRQMEFLHALEENVDARWKLFGLCAPEEQFTVAYCVSPDLKEPPRSNDLSGHTLPNPKWVCQ